MSFIQWLEENDLLYKKYQELKEHLETFLTQYISYGNDKQQVCDKFLDALSKCDEITYEEDGVSIAYIILHFLDRYRRFQLIYIDLFNKNLLPIKEKVDILDVGSGPGPSMFAMSDIYELFRRYQIESRGESSIKEINIEYVEKSREFTNFLHHFTEHANYRSGSGKDWFYHIPYHHTIFSDIIDLKFNETNTMLEWEYDEDGCNSYYKNVRIKRRYDLAIFSNFLTNREMVISFRKQLKETAFYLRNKGLFVVVGAVNQSPKYNGVYSAIDDCILKQKYNTSRFGGHCKKVLDSHKMSCSFSDIFGRSVMDSIIKGVKLFADNNLESNLSPEFKKIFDKWNKPNYEKEIKWEVNVYKRISWPKK